MRITLFGLLLSDKPMFAIFVATKECLVCISMRESCHDDTTLYEREMILRIFWWWWWYQIFSACRTYLISLFPSLVRKAVLLYIILQWEVILFFLFAGSFLLLKWMGAMWLFCRRNSSQLLFICLVWWYQNKRSVNIQDFLEVFFFLCAALLMWNRCMESLISWYL